MKGDDDLQHLATLCGALTCKFCPEVLLDNAADPDKQVVIKDDFGNTVRMSRAQFNDFVRQAKAEQLNV